MTYDMWVLLVLEYRVGITLKWTYRYLNCDIFTTDMVWLDLSLMLHSSPYKMLLYYE